MKLEEFIKKLHEEVDEFKEYYLQERKKDPKNWPLKFEEVDWFEQFITYDGMREKND